MLVKIKRLTIPLYSKQEYKNVAGDFIPSLNAYLHEDNKKRPAIIIAPGGGYLFVSSMEAYVVAISFFNAGYQVYVLTYTVSTLGIMPVLLTQPLKDMSRAVCEVRKRSKQDFTIENNVAVLGFSAGGHLCASIAVHFAYKGIKSIKDEGISNKPDAVVLCYPFITKKYTANNADISATFKQDEHCADIDMFALDKQVKNDTPPTFLWHTVDDAVVDVNNSIDYMIACKNNNVPVEMHIYPKGWHGLSVANEQWAKNEVGDSFYTFEQNMQDVRYMLDNMPDKIPEAYNEVKNLKLEQFAANFFNVGKQNSDENNCMPEFDKSISNWPVLCTQFLNKVWNKLL